MAIITSLMAAFGTLVMSSPSDRRPSIGKVTACHETNDLASWSIEGSRDGRAYVHQEGRECLPMGAPDWVARVSGDGLVDEARLMRATDGPGLP